MKRATSRHAYHTVKANGLLSRCHFQVYQALYLNGDMTQRETHKYLLKQGVKVQLNSVSPCFAPLERAGVIYPSYTRPCKITGYKCLVWKVENKLPKKDKAIPKKTWWIIGGRAFRKKTNATKWRKSGNYKQVYFVREV